MSHSLTFDARILGGLPVVVRANIYPAEPDVGIFSEQVEVVDIYWPGRKGKPIPQHMWERLGTKGIHALQEEALEACCE
jgi:hypothetical protein